MDANTASAPQAPSGRLSSLDGLAPILLGVLAATCGAVGFLLLEFAKLTARPDYGQSVADTYRFLGMTRSDWLHPSLPFGVGWAAVLFAGLCRAVLAKACALERLPARGLGRAAFVALALGVAAYSALAVSLQVPEIWPTPAEPPGSEPLRDDGDVLGFGKEAGAYWLAVITPPPLFRWLDCATIALFYAAFWLYAAQIAWTSWVVGRATDRISSALLGFGASSVLALIFLPLSVFWNVAAVLSSGDAETVSDVVVAARADGSFYLFDHSTLSTLEFILIPAALGLLGAVVERDEARSAHGASVLGAAFVCYMIGAGLFLSDFGLETKAALDRCLRIASGLCAVPLLVAPPIWLSAVIARGAPWRITTIWALIAAAPAWLGASACLALAVWLEPSSFPDFMQRLGWLHASFPYLGLILSPSVVFAVWYAYQRDLFGRCVRRSLMRTHFFLEALAAIAFFPAFFGTSIVLFALLLTPLFEIGDAALMLNISLVAIGYVVFIVGLLTAQRAPTAKVKPVL